MALRAANADRDGLSTVGVLLLLTLFLASFLASSRGRLNLLGRASAGIPGADGRLGSTLGFSLFRILAVDSALVCCLATLAGSNTGEFVRFGSNLEGSVFTFVGSGFTLDECGIGLEPIGRVGALLGVVGALLSVVGALLGVVGVGTLLGVVGVGARSCAWGAASSVLRAFLSSLLSSPCSMVLALSILLAIISLH
jgi:hypothetical protein